MRIPLFHVDAFTDRPFHGNSAAVCLLDSWLDDAQLRKVAAENNLSATAFVVPAKNLYELRWFTPSCEVRLCGHATMAAAFVLLTQYHPRPDSILFQTGFHDLVTVSRQGSSFCMDLPAMQPQKCAAPVGITQALELQTPPAEVVHANQVYALVVNSAEAVRSVGPNFALLEKFHPNAIAVTAPGTNCDFVSRYFAPGYGVPEDPVTGSLHCVLTPYWAKRLSRTQLHARQLSEREGELGCELNGDRVLVKGNAVLMMEAVLEI